MVRKPVVFLLACRRIIRGTLQSLSAVGLVVAASTILVAQMPTPKLSSIFPPGGKLGAQFDVKVTGSDQDDAVKLIFSHEGITASVKMTAATEFESARPIAGSFSVAVAATVPPGIYEARLLGRFGVSNPRAFIVGSENETIEPGGNTQRSSAAEIAVGTIVNGRADASNVDYYKFSLKKGQRILIDCCAHRIDSRMDATLVLFDAEGKELARNRDTIGRDPLLDFTAPADGSYVVGVYDFVYGGGADYYYRLHVHTQPFIDFVFPPSAVAGAKAHFTIYGRNLPGGEVAEGVVVDGATLQRRVVGVDVPADESSRRQLPIGALVEPRGALLDGFVYRLANSNPVTLRFAKAPLVIEHEPNDEPAAAQKVAVPCEYVGQFFPARDDDWIQFDALKGEVYWIEVISHRLGLECDPYMIVQRVTTNAQGQETASDIAQIDDPSNRNSRIGTDFDTSTDDPSYRFSVPADGVYRVRVRDQFGSSRPDPRNVYRLVIRGDQPDFRLLALPSSGPVANRNQVLTASAVLRRGGTEMIEVRVDRRDGFSGDVAVSVDGLPAGVTCTGVLLSGRDASANLVLVAAENAAAWTGPIRIVGKASIDGKEVIRTARGGTVVWGTSNRTQVLPEFRATRNFALSVVATESAPALVQADATQVWETSLGGTLVVPIKVTRRGGFKADLKLTAAGLPSVIKPAAVTVKGDAADAKFTIAITNAKTKPGQYSLYLTSTAKFKYSRNPDAIQTAQQQQQRIDQAIKQLTDQSAAAQAVAAKAVQDADSAIKAATQAVAVSEKAKIAADAASKGAADNIASALASLNQQPENQDLTDQLKSAQQAKAAADAKIAAAARKLAADRQALSDAQAAAKTAARAKVAAAKAVAAFAAKLKLAQAAKKAIDKRLADAKKANAAKDINITLVSTPITFRVVESPIGLTVPAPAEALRQNAKMTVSVTIQRKYGFDDKVDLTLELPSGVAGISAAKLSVPKGQTTGTLHITAAGNATPGKHTLTVRAKSTFNKISVQTAQPIVLTIHKADAPAK